MLLVIKDIIYKSNYIHIEWFNDPYVKYRPMKYRIDEAIVKYKGYKLMGNLIGGIPYVVKPILVGLIPQKILYMIKKKRY